MAQEVAAKAKATARPRAVVEEAKWVGVKCAFCRGTGRDPFKVLSPLWICPACGGSGKALIEEPYKSCPACQGTGLHFGSRMYCWACRGTGVSSVNNKNGGMRR